MEIILMKTQNQLKLLALGLAMALMPTLYGMENKEIDLTPEAQQQEKLNNDFLTLLYKSCSFKTRYNRSIDEKLFNQAKEKLEQGADINTIWGSGTALWHATATRSPEIVRYLIEQGADPNMKKVRELSPLMKGTWNNSYLIKYLIEHGADITITSDSPYNFTGLTALGIAQKWTQYDTSRDLLQDAQTFYEMPDKTWVIGTDSNIFTPEVKEMGFNIIFNTLDFFKLMNIQYHDEALQKISERSFKKGICLLHLKNLTQLTKCIENNWHVDALPEIKDRISSNPNSRFSRHVMTALGKTKYKDQLLEKLNNNNFSDVIIN